MNIPDLKTIEDLYGLFKQAAPEASQLAANQLPQPERTLLAHENHHPISERIQIGLLGVRD